MKWYSWLYNVRMVEMYWYNVYDFHPYIYIHKMYISPFYNFFSIMSVSSPSRVHNAHMQCLPNFWNILFHKMYHCQTPLKWVEWVIEGLRPETLPRLEVYYVCLTWYCSSDLDSRYGRVKLNNKCDNLIMFAAICQDKKDKIKVNKLKIGQNQLVQSHERVKRFLINLQSKVYERLRKAQTVFHFDNVCKCWNYNTLTMSQTYCYLEKVM